jgi:hypothetical protein
MRHALDDTEPFAPRQARAAGSSVAAMIAALDDKRPVYPREVHQGTIPRETTRQGIFRALSEGSISDRGRKLARASVSEYRVYDEAAKGASQIMRGERRCRSASVAS